MSNRTWYQQKIVHYQMHYRGQTFDKYEIVGGASGYAVNEQAVDFNAWYAAVTLARIQGQVSFWRKPKYYTDGMLIAPEVWYENAILFELGKLGA
jgi:hypothetical protein